MHLFKVCEHPQNLQRGLLSEAVNATSGLLLLCIPNRPLVLRM